jgi:hypothetical protein
VENPCARAEAGSANDVVAAETAPDLTHEHASRVAVLAVAADLEYWARAVSTDGCIGLNDLTRTLLALRRWHPAQPGLPREFRIAVIGPD